MRISKPQKRANCALSDSGYFLNFAGFIVKNQYLKPW